MPTVKISDVARAANVSISTVSRVLNNPEIVKNEKKTAVLKAIDKLGYVPNAAAREMGMKASRLIGVLVSDISNSYIANAVGAFSSVMEQKGYGIFISITSMNAEREEYYIETMLQRNVEAVIMFGIRPIDARFFDWVTMKLGDIPLIKVGPGMENCYYMIATDEENGGYIAAEHLIRLNHRKIGFFSCSLGFDSYYFKHLGFQAAMKDYGVPINEKWMLTELPGSYEEQTYKQIYKCLRREDRPTGIVLAGDPFALAVYRAAGELGLRIPEDISVVGYGNSNLAPNIRPQLTSVNQGYNDLVKKTAKLVENLLNGKRVCRKTVLGVTLAERQSTCPAK